MVLVLQFVEGLTDRQAVEAVRARTGRAGLPRHRYAGPWCKGLLLLVGVDTNEQVRRPSTAAYVCSGRLTRLPAR